jgi:hypothetical protein
MTQQKHTITLCEACRVCGSPNLRPILSLGEQYAVGFLEDPQITTPKGPLDLVLCNIADGGCGLLQLRHTFDHDLLYRRYWYQSGISTTMVKALRDVVQSAQATLPLRSGDVVIDIGANDGTLLKQYQRADIHRVGFEPSNLWTLAQSPGIEVINDYFNYEAWRARWPNKQARIITSVAMFYDLDRPNAFVEDIKKCLADDGLWVIQMNYLGLMLENHTYDNISHEHLEYYSLLSLENLLVRHDLEIIDVELNDVNGGSYRVYVRKKGAAAPSRPGGAERVHALREKELRLGYDDVHVYANFSADIAQLKEELLSILRREVAAGRRFFIYGASTRGLVVLQYAGIDHGLIEAAVDKNADKWGKYIVGTGIPVISLDEYRARTPDYLLVLPYQFKDEIVHQEQEFLDRGGKMLFALPRVEVVTSANLTELAQS